MIESLSQNWINFNWLNDLKATNTYDEDNNWITSLAQNWDGISWINDSSVEFTYDGDNNRIEFLRQSWDGSNWVNELMATYTYSITGVEHLEDIVESFILSQNYPNPFNPSTKISYQIPASLNPSKGGTFVTLKVFDILGREITTLVNEIQNAGVYEIEFNASQLSSGIYLYVLKAGSIIQSKKMVLIR